MSNAVFTRPRPEMLSWCVERLVDGEWRLWNAPYVQYTEGKQYIEIPGFVCDMVQTAGREGGKVRIVVSERE